MGSGRYPAGVPAGSDQPLNNQLLAARARGNRNIIKGVLPVLENYRQQAAERAALGIPALPLSPQQTADLVELFKNPPKGEESFLLDLLTHRVPAGVDQAAYVKAAFLPPSPRAKPNRR